MDLILCHTTADFDAVGAAVGLTRLKLGARIVLTGGAHPAVRDFLALHRDEYALIERRAVTEEEIQSLVVVDTQKRDRLGKAAEWLDLPHLTSIEVYDHHLDIHSDIPSTGTQIEPVGATTTLIVEQLQQISIQLTTAEATVMALGIHVDTGSLTFDQTTPRDAAALAWLMAQGANIRQIAQYVTPSLSPELQKLLREALENLRSQNQSGYTISWVILKTPNYVPGLSTLATQLMELTESDALLLAAEYPQELKVGMLKVEGSQELKVEGSQELKVGRLKVEGSQELKVGRLKVEGSQELKVEGLTSSNVQPSNVQPATSSNVQPSNVQPSNVQPATSSNVQPSNFLTVIGRSRIDGTNLNELLQPLGGGGHSQAASMRLRDVESQAIIEQLVNQLRDQIPQPLTAQELMSSPVRTIRPQTTIGEAQRILLRYGHSGLSVVDEQDQLVGVVSRRDIDLALHHGFGHAPVKGYMTKNIKTITPQTPLSEIESLMVTYDIGRLPVLKEGQLVGIVTRTDVLRQLHQGRGNREWKIGKKSNQSPIPSTQFPVHNLRSRLAAPLWALLNQAAQEAQQRGWHLYLVGGAVRDVLLADAADSLLLNDIDLVVDGFHRSADVGAGVALAEALQKIYPNARLEVHGSFQTAALLWHDDPIFDSLWLDIATARTEFYPYPAANPEVEASSIRQDLYRRDFTINAMAVRLTASGRGDLPLLDFFGGLLDLRSRQIRVLHANSFIEDPTRIYRAVRFAVRLNFQIEPQTEAYIRYAIESGVYERSLLENSKAPALQTRLKAELKYILQAPYWERALLLLSSLEALRCLHPNLTLDEQLWWQVRLVDRWLRRFDLDKSLEHWQMRLEVLIAHLAPEERGKIAKNLQLPLDSIERLQQLAQAQANVVESLPTCKLKSEVVRLLRPYKLPILVLIAVQSPRAIRGKLWKYLTTWANVEAPLNGNDLKQLGYKPGPKYRQILDALLEATLDRVIQDKSDAKAFLAAHYPFRG